MDRKKPIDGLFSPIERPSRARWVRDGRMSRADDDTRVSLSPLREMRSVSRQNELPDESDSFHSPACSHEGSTAAHAQPWGLTAVESFHPQGLPGLPTDTLTRSRRVLPLKVLLRSADETPRGRGEKGAPS